MADKYTGTAGGSGLSTNKYPDWICHDCGAKHGRRPMGGISTWHQGICGVCGSNAPVTEPRDYGHLRHGWNQAVAHDIDQAAFQRMTERGRKTWKDIPNATAWVDELRGDPPQTKGD